MTNGTDEPKDAAAHVNDSMTQAGAAAGDTAARIKDSAAKAADKLRNEASSFASQATEGARTAAAQGKDRAVSAGRNLGTLVDETAASIDKNLGESYGNYARNAAKFIHDLADKLDARDVDGLIEDTRRAVAKSPAIAMGTAAVVGFVLARLLRAGHDHDAA